MIWVYLLGFMFLCLAAVEWTSRPRRQAKDDSAPEAEQQRIPQPRKPAGDRSVRYTRRLP
ncbi:hypothetical protein [Nocardioides sp. SR21]|uniref:hypothetical protein n=1 Tax=Nocardioides sp. SR21 TaxID=2919501 RepID=UPI001FA9ED4E|nr:hypothetical protein [Nocardioides sp. SR21]